MTPRQLSWSVAAVWAGVIASALAVVHVSHNCRTLYAELARLEQGYNQAQVEWGQLLLEQAAVASFSGVEKLAQDQLNMRAPSAADIVVVQQ